MPLTVRATAYTHSDPEHVASAWRIQPAIGMLLGGFWDACHGARAIREFRTGTPITRSTIGMTRSHPAPTGASRCGALGAAGQPTTTLIAIPLPCIGISLPLDKGVYARVELAKRFKRAERTSLSQGTDARAGNQQQPPSEAPSH